MPSARPAHGTASKSEGSKYWQEIKDLTKSLGSMTTKDGPIPTLQVDPHIVLYLPDDDEIRAKLHENLRNRPIPEAIEQQHVLNCSILKRQVELSYTNALSKTTSIKHLIGITDRQCQRDMRDGFQRWFSQAEAKQIQYILDPVFESSRNENRKVFESTTINSFPIKAASVQTTDSDPVDILMQAFQVQPSPNDKERETLARACGISYKQVTTWFQNRRQRTKNRPVNPEAGRPKRDKKPHCTPRRLPIRKLPQRNNKAKIPAFSQNAQQQRTEFLCDQSAGSEVPDEPSDLMAPETRNGSLLFERYAHGHALPLDTIPTVPTPTIRGADDNGSTKQRLCAPLTPSAAITELCGHPSHSHIARAFAIPAPLPPLTVLPRPLPHVPASGETPSSRSIRALPKAKARFVKNTAGELPNRQSALSHGTAIPSGSHELFTSQPLPLNERTIKYEQCDLRVPSLTRSVSSASNSTIGSDSSFDQQEAPSVFGGPQHGSQGIPPYPHTVFVPISRERGTAQWTGSSDTGFATPVNSKWEAPAGYEYDRTPTQQRFNEQAAYSSPTVQYQTSRFGSSTYFIPQRDGYQLMTSQDGSQFWVATSDLVPTATNLPETFHRHTNEQELRVVSNSLPMVSQEFTENKGLLTPVTGQSSDATPPPYLEGGGELNAYIVNEALERLSSETSLMKPDGYSFSFDEMSDVSGEDNLMDEFTLKDMEALLSLSATPEPAPGGNVSPGSDTTVALPGLSSSESSPDATQVITPQTANLDKGKKKEGSLDQNPEHVATVKTESSNEDAWVTPESTTLDSFFTGAEWEWGLLPFDMPGVDEVFTLCTESI